MKKAERVSKFKGIPKFKGEVEPIIFRGELKFWGGVYLKMKQELGPLRAP